MHSILAMMGVETAQDAAWLVVGILGQVVFTARLLVQWIASERAKRSVVPVAFWYFSLVGGAIVLVYGIHRMEPVLILGQLPGVVVYSRNLWLIHAERRRAAG